MERCSSTSRTWPTPVTAASPTNRRARPHRAVWALGLAALLLAGCAGEPLQPPANEPHGELWVRNPSPVIRNVLPVRVLAVDGHKVVSDLSGVRVRPGRHEVLLIVGEHEIGPGETRLVKPAGETPGLLLIDVEAGKRYHLAGRAESAVGLRWTPLVWKVTELPWGSASAVF